jgi:hypothetical protein
MNTDQLFEIIVNQETLLTGKNLIEIIQCLDLQQRMPHVVVADIECNGDRTWVQKPPFPTTVQEVVNYASRVGQFDWATFFFFSNLRALTEEDYRFEQLFARAALTIRAVDDSNFYIYTPLAKDVTHLSQKFRIEFSKKLRDAIKHPT